MLAMSTPLLVVSFVPAATSSLIRDVQEVTSANVFHCCRVPCIASSAGCQSKTPTRQKRHVWGTTDENGRVYRTVFFRDPDSHELCPVLGIRDHADSKLWTLIVLSHRWHVVISLRHLGQRSPMGLLKG